MIIIQLNTGEVFEIPHTNGDENTRRINLIISENYPGSKVVRRYRKG